MARPIDTRPLTEKGGKHSQGESAINLFLAVLAQAKKDKAKLWKAYKERHRVGDNIDAAEVAHWVADYLTGQAEVTV